MVKRDTVSTALPAIGKEITLACNTNPTKLGRTEKLLPQLGQMLGGLRKMDSPILKKLPVEADVPKYLVKLGLQPSALAFNKAVGDLSLIAFYYLLCIGEYTVKGTRNESKQMQLFKMADVTFFQMGPAGHPPPTHMTGTQGAHHVSG